MNLLRIASRCAVLFLLLSGLAACSFDYGEEGVTDDGQPDIVMRGVEYVRVRDGKPVVRFAAELAERYEKRQAMELQNFSFDQFDGQGVEVNATGTVGNASVDMGTGNIQMTGGVEIQVDSEDLNINTPSLAWQDKERILSSGEMERVDIIRSDGTSFSGWGFSADARRRSWSFNDGAEGIYYHDEDDTDAADADSGAEPFEGIAGDETSETALEEPSAADDGAAGTPN